ncbi:MAG TPA: arginine--tRNA ligase [Roseiflexaceae bacterium]|nr:arginine--tRNA ligase [Roseiflexaceae bacterium]
MVQERLRALIESSIRAAQAAGALPEAELPDIVVEQPQRPEHGDFATPIALSLAKPMRRAPREIAQAIVTHLPANDVLATIEIAGAGYVNMRVRPDWLASQVEQVLDRGERYADLNLGQGRSAQVEFISANPTGPLTVGHGRNAVLGDTLAHVLAAAGWKVTREYYYNDAGLQMRNLGETVKLRARQLLGEEVELAENHYQGQYLVDIAQQTLAENGPSVVERDWTFFKEQARHAIFDDIHATCQRLGISFDVLTNEASYYESGAIWRVLEQLRERGYAYDADGAVWLRATAFGVDKDRVLVRSSGEPTYRLPDIAYHADKLVRGFDLIVTVLGVDHIAEVPDIAGALRVLGYDADRLRPLVYQFVTLLRNGQVVKMSTRKANYVTLDELVDEVGADAVRFFMLMRSSESPIEFDLDLAKRQSDENPVFYVQYAHARCCSILRKADDRRPTTDDQFSALPQQSVVGGQSSVVVLAHPAELTLIKEILRLGDVLKSCATSFDLHQLTFYARDLASALNVFYHKCPVLAAEDPALVQARLKLVRAAQIGLARTLGLMGMSAPEQM